MTLKQVDFRIQSLKLSKEVLLSNERYLIMLNSLINLNVAFGDSPFLLGS